MTFKRTESFIFVRLKSVTKSTFSHWAGSRWSKLGTSSWNHTGAKNWKTPLGKWLQGKKFLESTKSPNYTYSIVFERIGFLSALEDLFLNDATIMDSINIFLRKHAVKKRARKWIVPLKTFSALSILYLVRSKVE